MRDGLVENDVLVEILHRSLPCLLVARRVGTGGREGRGQPARRRVAPDDMFRILASRRRRILDCEHDLRQICAK